MNWESWRKTVEYSINKTGRWYGLGDGDGYPLGTLQVPNELVAPDQWLAVEDMQFTLPAEGAVMQHLIDEGIDGFSIDGKLGLATGDYTLLYATRGADGETVRRGGVITHATADYLAGTLTVSALGTGDVWNTVVAVSWPSTWWNAEPYERTSDESGEPYPEPWFMARTETATRLSYVNKYGRARFVIARLAQESLDAAMSTQKDPDGTWWVDDPYHVVEVSDEPDLSPRIALEARDGSLWETVQDQAKNAGVQLSARVWWPGDPPVRCWSPVTSSTPGAEVDISPDDGSESARTLDYRTFDHSMIILEVK